MASRKPARLAALAGVALLAVALVLLADRAPRGPAPAPPATAPPPPAPAPASPAPAPRAAPRDWSRHPAVLELRGVRRVVALSDIHGSLQRLVATLSEAGLIDRDARGAWRWSGADTVCVVTGDLCDRGPQSLEVFRLLRDLEGEAARAGGRLVVTLGNHEVMLLSGEVAARAARSPPGRREGYQATLDSLAGAGEPLDQLLAPTGWLGTYLRRMPVMVVVNERLGFMHAGLGAPRTRAQLAEGLRRVVDGDDWQDEFLSPRTEEGLAACPVWARSWWDDPAGVDAMLEALELDGLVFGHTRTAFVPPGDRAGRGEVRAGPRGKLFKIDVGMTPAYGDSQGGSLEVLFHPGRADLAARYPDRPRTSLGSLPLKAAGPSRRGGHG